MLFAIRNRKKVELKKSAIIATCLVNLNIFRRIENAENAVQNVFLDEFQGADFHSWNRDISDKTAEEIINAVGCASKINVRKFIEDLWD